MTDYREHAEYWENKAMERGRLLMEVEDRLKETYHRGARDAAHDIADYIEEHVNEDKYKHLSGDILDLPAPEYKD